MKKIYPLLLASLLLAGCFSCQKEEGYIEGVEAHISYENPQQVIYALDSLYHAGAPTFYGENSSFGIPVAAVGGYMSGFFADRSTRTSALYEYCSQLTFDADNISSYLASVWSESYRAIRLSNELIVRVAGTQGLPVDRQKQIEAEARFFRAYNYFYLAKAFGSVSVVTDYRSSVESVVPTGLSAVYGLITNDLQQAIPVLTDGTSNTQITRAAAQTLLADAYLTMSGYPLQQDRYAQAAEAARAIIEGGQHALATGDADASAYHALINGGMNTENIYRYAASGSRSLAAMSLPEESSEWGVVKKSTGNTYQPTDYLLKLYAPEDLRAQERQYFHSFLKYSRNGRTVIRTFEPLPYMWFDEHSLLGEGVSRKHTILYRYAEVLLIAAEAIAATEGVTSEAVEYLAAVRARAYPQANPAEVMSELMALNTEEFIKTVWSERLREFPLEMKSWSDVQRTRQYPTQSADGSILFQDVLGAMNPHGAAFRQENLLFPKP